MAGDPNMKYDSFTYTTGVDPDTIIKDFYKGDGDYYIHTSESNDHPLLALVTKDTINLNNVLHDKVTEFNAETALGNDPYPEITADAVDVTYLVFRSGKYYMPIYGRSDIENYVEVNVDESIMTTIDKKEFFFIDDAKFKNVAGCMVYTAPAFDDSGITLLYYNEDCTVPILDDDMPFVYLNGFMLHNGTQQGEPDEYYPLTSMCSLYKTKEINMWGLYLDSMLATTEEAYEKLKELNSESNTPQEVNK